MKKEEKKSESYKLVDPHIVSLHQPYSFITDEFRNLCVDIMSMNGSKPNRVIVVTGSRRDERKNVTLCNLSVCMVRELNKKVLLVDADFKNPAVHQLFGIDVKNGLLDYVKNGLDLGKIVKEGPVPDLSIVTTGQITEGYAGFFNSARIRQFIDEVRGKFDFVFINTPPVIPYSDGSLLASMTDGVILVIQSGKTQREVVDRAKEVVENANSKVLGCILTDVKRHVPEPIYRFFR
jgi:capsular exopolysaccharide synthesis family protein